MNTNFTQNGIRYSLLSAPSGRREVEDRQAEIQPDKSLWTSRQKKKAGMSKKGYGWRNRHGGGIVLSFLDEPKGSRKQAKVDGRGPSIEIKAVPQEQFLETAPAD